LALMLQLFLELCQFNRILGELLSCKMLLEAQHGVFGLSLLHCVSDSSNSTIHWCLLAQTFL
jgi:hypothetical protein